MRLKKILESALKIEMLIAVVLIAVSIFSLIVIHRPGGDLCLVDPNLICSSASYIEVVFSNIWSGISEIYGILLLWVLFVTYVSSYFVKRNSSTEK